ncbi:hypothetical protein [Pedobacter sp. ASV28]|uniref:hypothetical protein n=1 Tax=Pedobacter sp. ASV28 TaxID=2795123 RepID=UPI0018EAA7E4|nr:hypothetical protein [Pedobacter sp. ASV28]
MSDKLEGFIKENKKQFEVGGPSDQLWNRIAAELDKKPVKKNIRLYQWLSVAAMLVLSLGIYFGYQHKKINGEIIVADINPNLGKKEVRFTSLIEEKRDSLQVFANSDPELYKKFMADLGKIDADYQELKKQLQTSPNKALVGKAMMKNLEIQLQMISQQLYIINQVNQYKKESII